MNPELQEYGADAKAKLDALPARIIEERAAATEEGREPYPLVPLVQVNPAVLRPFLESVGSGKVPDEIAETYGTVLRTCKRQQQPFAMRADQLLALLELKKSKPEKPEKPE